MVLQLDPRHPLVWRDPFTIQFGADEPVVIVHDVDTVTERMLAALVSGISVSGLTMIGGSKAEPLHELLAPVLVVPPTANSTIVIIGRTGITDRVAHLLATEGLTVQVARDAAAAADAPADLGIAIADFVHDPQVAGVWLRRDIPHVAATIGDSTITIGPVVEPGVGPCLHCVHEWQSDADPAWTAIATQLWGKPAAPSELVAAEAAAAIARVARERLRGAVGNGAAGDGVAGAREEHLGEQLRIRIDDGHREVRRVAVHPQCECHDAISVAAPHQKARRESDSADAVSRHPVDVLPTRVTIAPALA
jgi:hypothetical protein